MSETNRRDFIRNILRIGMAGGLITTGIMLGSGPENPDSDTNGCRKPSPCQKCNRFRGCTQPRALATVREFKSVSDTLQIKR